MATATMTQPTTTTPPVVSLVSESAFTALYNQQFSRLVGWFAKRVSFSSGVSRKEEAEDLTQETFLKLYTSSFRGDCSLKTWLYTIADSVWKDWNRKEKASCLEQAIRGGPPSDIVDDGEALPWEDALPDHNPNPEEAMILAESKTEFSDPRLTGLDRDERELLTAFFVDKLPINDIADNLGITTAAAYKRIERLSKKLPSHTSI